MLTADGKGYLGVEINTSKGRCSCLQDFDKLMPSDLIRHQEVCTESPTRDTRVSLFMDFMANEKVM